MADTELNTNRKLRAEIERNREAIAELVKALKGMGDMWTSVCMSHGWDPSHLEQFDVARAAITKHTTTTTKEQ